MFLIFKQIIVVTKYSIKMKTKFILTFFLVIILFLNSNAQGLKAVQKSDSTDCKAWGVNVSFGSALFYGDLKQYELYPLGKSNRYAVSERKTAYAIAVNKDFGRIFSIQGQLLKSLELTQQQTAISISDFSKGLFFIRLINENNTFVIRFVKE